MSRLWDLTLVNHEYDMVQIRAKEIGHAVDSMLILQPLLRFQDGARLEHARPPFPRELLSLHPNMKLLHRVPPAGLGADNPACISWCRDNWHRNELARIFFDHGGGDDDVVLVSDLDEIPRAEMLPALRRWNDSTHVLSLASIHMFKRTFRCEQPGPWLKGPVLLTGRLLRKIGAQAARTTDGCDQRGPQGFLASCRDPPRLQLPDSSWHLSSMSGGLLGNKFKLLSGSGQVSGGDVKTAVMVERERTCAHELGGGIFKNHAYVTPWSATNLPTYPDVPKYIEAGLRAGKFEHLLNFTEPVSMPALDELLDYRSHHSNDLHKRPTHTSQPFSIPMSLRAIFRPPQQMQRFELGSLLGRGRVAQRERRHEHTVGQR